MSFWRFLLFEKVISTLPAKIKNLSSGVEITFSIHHILYDFVNFPFIPNLSTPPADSQELTACRFLQSGF